MLEYYVYISIKCQEMADFFGLHIFNAADFYSLIFYL